MFFKKDTANQKNVEFNAFLNDEVAKLNDQRKNVSKSERIR